MSEETRAAVRKSLAQALRTDLESEAVASIEKAMGAALVAGSKEYSAKARSLVSNFKGNADLREQVLSGALGPVALVSASVKDLAPDKLKMQRQLSAERHMASRTLRGDETDVAPDGPAVESA